MRFRFVSALLGGLSLAPAQALDLSDTVQMHGFISQSAVYTSQNRIAGSQPGRTGWDMREIGANLSWRPDADWLVSGQLLSRRAGNADNGGVRVDYAFVDRLLVSGEHTVGLRLGKIKNPFGFYNTTRDVAHTRPGVLLPQSIYHDQVRSFFLSAPGVSLYGDASSDRGNWQWQASLLQPEVNDRNLTVFMVDNQPGSFTGKPSGLARVLWEGETGWRAGVSLGSFKMRYRPAAVDFLSAGAITLNTALFSLEHNSENWTHTAEYAQTRQSRNGFNVPFAPILDQPSTIEAFYLQSQWRFAPRWQALLRYDNVVLDQSDRGGARYSAATGMPAAQRYARDWTLGTRFDPTPDWSLFVEAHHVNGAAWLSKLDNAPATTRPSWDMLLMQAAWRF